eukprot:contig_29092_g7152
MRTAGLAAAVAAAIVVVLAVGGPLTLSGAAAQTCARRDLPYPHPQLGTGAPPRKVRSATDRPPGEYPVVYEGITGEAGWDGKPGVAELVLLSPSLAAWKYRRNLHNGALYTSPVGHQGVFPLGMSYPPLFQFRYAVTDGVVTPPSDCNATEGGEGGG